MYRPVKDGIEKKVQSVRYTEAKPSGELPSLVDCFWELKTDTELEEDFFLHALPDACVNILFNQISPEIAGITALNTTFTVLNLGTTFHYVGIQFLPGVWQGSQDEIVDAYVGTPYVGNLPLIAVGNKMFGLGFLAKQEVLSDLVIQLIKEDVVVLNPVTEKILTNIDSIRTVGDMATLTDLSPRQLQRVLKQTTGFSPHNLLKVLRLQRSFSRGHMLSYSDQSHFIKSFRKITGYTPEQYARKFDV